MAYTLSTVSGTLIDLYNTASELSDLNVFNIEGDCYEIYINDYIKASTNIAEYIDHLAAFVLENISVDNEESAIIKDYVTEISTVCNQYLSDLEVFDQVFEYNIIRIYDLPAEVTNKDKLHESALSILPMPRLKLITTEVDGYTISIYVSVNPLSNVEVSAVAVVTSDYENYFDKVELEK